MISDTTFGSILRSTAKNCGFDLAGVTKPFVSAYVDKLREYVSSGKYEDMMWLADTMEKRIDIRKSFSGTRSIISLGACYRKGKRLCDNRAFAYISCYARINDYHRVLKDSAKKFIKIISEIMDRDIKYRIFVDSAPILEKEIAQKAGLGFIGKNTLLINPYLGSFIFLAEILTDIDIEYENEYVPANCGDCTRCIEACPTGALSEHRLDPSRCISYLTIENKKIIPDNIKKKMGNMIFGCDLCQTVCPYNKREEYPGSLFKAGHLHQVDRDKLQELLMMDESHFYKRFSDYPIYRAGFHGFRRNLLICMGNSGISALKPLIQPFLSDQNYVIKDAAAYALNELG